VGREKNGEVCLFSLLFPPTPPPPPPPAAGGRGQDERG
jgi:hypothetical protein